MNTTKRCDFKNLKERERERCLYEISHMTMMTMKFTSYPLIHLLKSSFKQKLQQKQNKKIISNIASSILTKSLTNASYFTNW